VPLKCGGEKMMENNGKEIDFSARHNYLLRAFDGTLLPQDVPYFKSLKIADQTWQVLSDGDYFYVLAGDREAMCIDGGYGCGNARKYAEQLCGKPVHIIANTHDHFDHTANNSYFDCAYMSAATAPLANHKMASFEGVDFPTDYQVKIIEPGYEFHLGSRDVEVFSFPDHAAGSISFLDRKSRMFFVGDELSDWNKDLRRITVEKFARQMEVMWSHEAEYDWCCSGTQIFHKTYVQNYLNNANWILAGHEGSFPVPELEPHKPMVNETDAEGHVIYNRR